MAVKKPLVLVILDGWGYRNSSSNNAIATAITPQWDEWWNTKSHMLLSASGLDVGLPDLQMGNSEVGHMHIGAGRIIYQDFTRINAAIASKEFFYNPVFLNVIKDIKQTGKTLHVMGLFSPGGVHSHEEHLFAFLKICQQQHFNKIQLHLFLDGRDTAPKSALKSVLRLQDYLKNHPVAQVSSISGRYYAMDRDKRWDRVEPVYNLITCAQSENHFNDVEEAISFFYNQNISDEFIPPTLIGAPTKIVDGDALFFFNFRADRARQLSEAFLQADFQGFQRLEQPSISHFISMTHYAKHLPTEYAYAPMPLRNTFGEIISLHGLKQLRIAETEKYAHVTFFFNGGNDQIFPLEERVLIPSPKVPTYDLHPEMSAPELTKLLVEAINEDKYDVIICNYANADMVGHSGNFDAAVKAIECLDECMRSVGEAIANKNGHLLITSDHGNAEEMYDTETQQPHTAHTCQPVPFLFVGKDWHFKNSNGSLIDIAPTLLVLLGINPPKEMTGHSLLVRNLD